LAPKTAVLLLAHGTPDTVEEVPEFLRNVTGGRAVPQPVIDEIKHRYSLIGRSPLRDVTIKQAELVACALRLPVYVGMRNWTPYIGEAVQKMAADAIERAVAICLAPQNSRTSVGLYKRALLGESGEIPFAVDFVESWHDHPLLIRAFAEKLDAGWRRACQEAGAKIPVIFTAHSVPTRTISR
jgi:ferrochelatase